MASINQVRAVNTTLTSTHPLVAVFLGGTAGIGASALLALARTHSTAGKGLRIYVVGRSQTKGNEVISKCIELCPAGEFIFVRAADLSLLKDVDRVCEGLMKIEREKSREAGVEARIDVLVMSQAIFGLEGRIETPEGLDQKFSLLYYSRVRAIDRLLPLLLRSSLPARIISVFGPHRDTKFFPSDLSLRSPKNYSFFNTGCHVAYMTTFFFESLAKKYEGKLSLIHYFPGLVLTDAFGSVGIPAWLKLVFWVTWPLMKWLSVPLNESGERVVFLAASGKFPARGSTETGAAGGEVEMSSDGIIGGGAYRADWNGKLIPIKKNYAQLREEGWEEKIWEHTNKAFEVIEKGDVFTE